MSEHIALDLVTNESVILDLTTETVELNVVEEDIVLEVVGGVGPRGIQGIQGDQGIQGIQGDVGPVGPEGPPGTSSGFFRHSQATADVQWQFVHDLQYLPAVTIVDSAGTEMFGDVTYVDDHTVRIDFGYPVAGFAYCT